MRPIPALSPISRRVLIAGATVALAGCEEATALPDAALPPVPGMKTAAGWPLPGIDTATFRGRVTVVNVWASWCPYCRGEHDLLKTLAGSGPFALVGVVHNDSAEAVRSYLTAAGNPYAALSVDAGSVLYRGLKARGVPHTYVIGKALDIVAKVPGALTEASIASVIRPGVARARAV